MARVFILQVSTDRNLLLDVRAQKCFRHPRIFHVRQQVFSGNTLPNIESTLSFNRQLYVLVIIVRICLVSAFLDDRSHFLRRHLHFRIEEIESQGSLAVDAATKIASSVSAALSKASIKGSVAGHASSTMVSSKVFFDSCTEAKDSFISAIYSFAFSVEPPRSSIFVESQTTMSTDKMIDAWKSQSEYFDEYNANLEKAKGFESQMPARQVLPFRRQVPQWIP